MTTAPLSNGSGPSGPAAASRAEGVDDLGTRHRQTLRILRAQGKANFIRRGEWVGLGLPLPKSGEGLVDWIVRAKLAPSPQDASAGLARALLLDPLLDALPTLAAADRSGADAPQPPRPQDGAGDPASPTPTAASAIGHGG